MGIQNRVALVTGSASGIGKQAARRMAENGAKVVINDIVAEKVEETVMNSKQTVWKSWGRLQIFRAKNQWMPWSRPR